MGLTLNTLKLAMKGFKPADIRRINEAGIDHESIIAMSEQGYTVKDVDELIKLASEEPGTTAGGDVQDNKEPEKPGETKPEPDVVNYKEENEKLKKELAESQETLKRIQDQNASKDLGGGQTEDPNKAVQAAFMGLY